MRTSVWCETKSCSFVCSATYNFFYVFVALLTNSNVIRFCGGHVCTVCFLLLCSSVSSLVREVFRLFFVGCVCCFWCTFLIHSANETSNHHRAKWYLICTVSEATFNRFRLFGTRSPTTPTALPASNTSSAAHKTFSVSPFGQCMLITFSFAWFFKATI